MTLTKVAVFFNGYKANGNSPCKHHGEYYPKALEKETKNSANVLKNLPFA